MNHTKRHDLNLTNCDAKKNSSKKKTEKKQMQNKQQQQQMSCKLVAPNHRATTACVPVCVCLSAQVCVGDKIIRAERIRKMC